MATYKNGQIPASILVRRGNHLLTAGTWAKVDALVADVQKRHGVTLRITDVVGSVKGAGAYRDRPMQRAMKSYYTALGRPWQAATEGTSSHGGEFQGVDALAFDINNYWAIPQAEFFAACRRAGLEPGYFDGKGGRPLEPWHVIDRDPYRTIHKTPPAPAGDETEPVIVPEEEADMPQIIRKKGTDEVSLLDPDVGRDLPRLGHGKGKAEYRGEKTSKGVVNVYRGFMVTTDKDVAAAWGRTWCRAYGNAPQDRSLADYKLAQAEASRLAFEKHG